MSRYGHVNFCEDMRREIGGQRSLIGCFSNSIKIRESFPYVLPKLCLDITFYSLKTEPYETLGFQIFAPGDDEEPFKTFEPKIDKNMWSGEVYRSDGSPLMTRSRTGLYFIGFPLQNVGSIVVYAICDGEKIRIGGLQVVKPIDAPAAIKESSGNVK